MANDDMMRVLLETSEANLGSACFRSDYGSPDEQCPYLDEIFTTCASQYWKRPPRTILPLEGRLVGFCPEKKNGKMDPRYFNIAIAATGSAASPIPG